MDAPAERKETIIDEEAKEASDYILSSQPELQEFFRNVWVVENITNLIVMHWDNPRRMGVLIKQQLEQDLFEECANNARERLE